ncbi:hypothetical protein WMF31_31440 [Sorangium sp. So ce1036]|uniref:hypothetical protein n=1 Tax=Sorangium sp. So ce1036 TaxID=3133328 RepID=UPI003F0DA9B0
MSLFQKLDQITLEHESPDVIFVIEEIRSIQEDGVLRLARDVGAGRIACLRQRSASPQSTPAEAYSAGEAVRSAPEELRKQSPSAAFHIVSTAPLALLVQLGRFLTPSVYMYRSALVYPYDPRTASYAPVLDVIDTTEPPQGGGSEECEAPRTPGSGGA